jgi:hypothetical protein
VRRLPVVMKEAAMAMPLVAGISCEDGRVEVITKVLRAVLCISKDTTTDWIRSAKERSGLMAEDDCTLNDLDVVPETSPACLRHCHEAHVSGTCEPLPRPCRRPFNDCMHGTRRAHFTAYHTAPREDIRQLKDPDDLARVHALHQQY